MAEGEGGGGAGEEALMLSEQEAGQQAGAGAGGDGAGNEAGGKPLGQRQDTRARGHETEARVASGAGPNRAEVIGGAASRGFAQRGYAGTFREYEAAVEDALTATAVPEGQALRRAALLRSDQAAHGRQEQTMTAPDRAPPPDVDARAAAEAVAGFRADIDRLLAEIGQRIVGQTEVANAVAAALLAGGHVLLEGVPGLGKTLLVRTLAEALDLSFSRIQFTPDLMPADMLGTNLIVEGGPAGERRGASSSRRGRSSRTSCWPTRSTARRRRRSRRCSRRCRSSR